MLSLTHLQAIRGQLRYKRCINCCSHDGSGYFSYYLWQEKQIM